MCKSIYKICKYLMFSKQIALNIQNPVCPQSWLSSNNVIQQMINTDYQGSSISMSLSYVSDARTQRGFRKLTLKRKENMEPVSDP